VSVQLIKQFKLAQAGIVFGALLTGSMVFADTARQEPLLLAAVSDGFNAEQSYRASCFACHNVGAGGAPKLDDKADWDSRLEKGIDGVMANVINGVNAMPAKGLCFTCTDDDLRAIVDYMIAQPKK
jgi:cytochrome c5